ncbi:MAG: JAB domain-containing protein [Clostridia bacterium]
MVVLHEGHRERLRARAVAEGLSNFQEHEILELVLFQSIPFKDTNEIAHALISKFGSFANVLDAPISELIKINGVSTITATNLSLYKQIFSYYKQSKNTSFRLKSLSEIITFAKDLLNGLAFETLYVVAVDSKNNYIGKSVFTSNLPSKIHISAQQIVETALQFHAAGIILFHAHPSGLAEPSPSDLLFTQTVYNTLKGIDIALLEHIIVAKDDFYSFYQNNRITDYQSAYRQNFVNSQIIEQNEVKLDD